MALVAYLPALFSARPPVLPSSDAALVAQLQAGSEAAFRALVEHYQGLVYRAAFSFVRLPEEAEDITQEVFMEVYQTIGQYRGEASLRTWLYRLTVSRALKHQERARTKKRFALFISLFGPRNEVAHDPADYYHPQAQLESQQSAEYVARLIARLPSAQQVAFTLRHEQDLSYEEIAAVLRTSVPAVESLLFRARQTLRRAFPAASPASPL